MTTSSSLAALGGVLEITRGIRGWSVERAARKAQLGHVTWRRIEDGHAVREKTYGQVETCLGLGPGSIRRALATPEAMVAVARDLGVDVSPVTDGTLTADEFAAQLARTITDRIADKRRREPVATQLDNDDVAAALREIADAMRTGLGQIAEQLAGGGR